MKEKRSGIAMLRALIDSGVVSTADLVAVARPNTPPDQLSITCDLESWLRTAGFEDVTHERLRLTTCPFSDDQIRHLVESGHVICCVPAATDASSLAATFHLGSWAASHPLVTRNVPLEDDWFATRATSEPPLAGLSARAARAKVQSNSAFGLTLQRYIVFLARMRTLTGQLPDQHWWTWLLRTKYDRSGVLIAGIDGSLTLSVHAWMSDFSARFVGCRSCILPDAPPQPESYRRSGVHS